MTKNAQGAAGTAVEFGSFDDLNAADISEMAVEINGKLTDWIWQFAGPGHPKTVEHNERSARDELHRSRQQEQARVNGKKWKPEDETVDEVRAKNIDWIIARLLGWSPVKIAGEDFAFTPENARSLLSDPRKNLLKQAVEFLTDEKSFIKRSAAS